MSMGKDPLAAELGRRGGRKGGRARALSLTPEQRREIAQRAAAARWQRGSDDEAEPVSLAHTPMVTARGAAEIDGQKLEAFVLEDGRKLIGLLSAALALDYTADQLAQRAADVTGEGALTFHVPGDWRLMRGIAPATLVGVCRALADAVSGGGRSDRSARGRASRAIGILAAAADEGLPAVVDAAARPVAETAQLGNGAQRQAAITD
jgi:hypothetical protein